MPRILVIDQDPGSVAITARILRRNGYEVQESPGNGDHFQKLCQFRPDLVLLGLRPSDVKSSPLVRALREDPDLSATFVVSISSSLAQPGDSALHHETGADGFITRPVSDEELLSRVDGFLELKRTQDKLRDSQQNLNKLVESNADGILIVSSDGEVLYANQAAARGFGQDKYALIGESFGFPLSPGESTEIEVGRSDGTVTLMEMRVVDLVWHGQPAWLASLRDITERHQAHEAMQARQRVQKTVLSVAHGVSGQSGHAFFEQLACHINEAVGSQAVIISRLMRHEGATLRTLSVVHGTRSCANRDHPLAGSFCEKLLSEGTYSVCRNLAQQSYTIPGPGWPDMAACMGLRLDNSAGQPIGFLLVLFSHPLQEQDLLSHTLTIFASRAAAEIERINTDVRIRDQASLLDKAQDAIMVLGIDQRVLYWNKSAERLYGWSADEAFGQSLESLIAENREDFAHSLIRVLEQGSWNGEATYRHRDGTLLVVEGRWSLVRDEDDRPQSMLVINTDITQRKAAEKEIENLAFFDHLTGLPNRRLLVDRLQQALAVTQRSGEMGALFFLDLDEFKTLNDTMGHDLGDQLLQEVASRLLSTVRESDTVARLGGDEFVLMLPSVDRDSGVVGGVASTISDKLLRSFQWPFLLKGQEYFITPSIGVTFFDAHSRSVDQLLKQADLAMYQAKAAGRNAVRFFDQEMESAVSLRVSREKELRQAIEQHQFCLYYQPQVNHRGEVVGAEALVRWQHPQRGLVSPAEFIPLAEETGLILELGRQVLRLACQQLMKWGEDERMATLVLSVNVSARQFRHPEFVAETLAVLDQSGAAPHRLKFELTESLMLDDMDRVIDRMGALRKRGVTFSLDDFGTGYSSLFYLKNLPLDQLKIDQSFVRDVLQDPNDAVIARTVIRLGQSLGLSVIAEGVEEEAQKNLLSEYGCLEYQGYYFSRPVPIGQFEAFMKDSCPHDG
ncbi:MAG: EAL domain-containing protein [Oleiphilaceae bacterium]|nr:EAL domain-containing protein [Oleiphilaceae bacterium]